jgi:SH3-like domain-containing protein
MPRALLFVTFLLAASWAVPPARAAADGPKIQRYVSLRSGKANLREGPTYSHRILWVYRHKGTPFAVLNSFDSWRKVMAPDGTVGWMGSVMLSEKRTVLVTGKGRAPILAKPGDEKVVALADPGAVADLKACTRDFCRISGADGIDGWIAKARIWGAGADEVFDRLPRRR